MTDPVWSVILLIVIGLLFAAYIIYYILREAYLEVQNGNKLPKEVVLKAVKNCVDVYAHERRFYC
jgi:uncharacterized membrane protein YraQ (UPF0718 family)